MYLFSFSSFAMFLVPAIDVRCTDCSRWPRFVLSCPSAMMHWHSLDLFLSTLNAMNVLGMWVGNTLCDADALELLSLAPSAHCISSAIPPELGTLIAAIYRVASDSFSSRSDRLWMLSASSVCSQAPATIRRLPWPAFDGLVDWRSGRGLGLTRRSETILVTSLRRIETARSNRILRSACRRCCWAVWYIFVMMLR